MQTKFYLPFAMNPSGCSIYISSYKSPCRKVSLMSNFSDYKSKSSTRLGTTCIDEIRTTEEKIYVKSIPCTSPKPLTSSFALNIFLFPFPSWFIRYTQFFFIIFLPFGLSTKSHVLLSCRYCRPYSIGFFSIWWYLLCHMIP